MVFPLLHLISLAIGTGMDNSVTIENLVFRATSVVVVQPYDARGWHTVQSVLHHISPRPMPGSIGIQSHSTMVRSRLPGGGPGKHLIVQTRAEPGMTCDRRKETCIALVNDDDWWARYTFVSDVECLPLSSLAAVQRALAKKSLGNNPYSLGHSIEGNSWEDVLRRPSHILVVDPLPPRQERTALPVVSEGRPYTYLVDRFRVVETLLALGKHPVPATIEVADHDQPYHEHSSTSRESFIQWHDNRFDATIPPSPKGRHVILVWERGLPGQYVYTPLQSWLPLEDLSKIRTFVQDSLHRNGAS